ncbi:tRNA (adenosine(37)-N6)-threonylcarbamoyltransferase complex ATPase subunit type 1 TsaE [Wenzhouxiangella limi]|uniref:tRNA threonylcarbamoyladenosine biosynthesis protein TsaE n=1 Tax=Wenzhouxiangella limi TaxID=2707351 RepID=A0A845UZZ7_9GAMM|nr:tRNA (adenosine(37)-N6)-threonylcarbamoyltransferase complex ATPase subunit type 1 TsaE [Wenzhouxiangella limi]NDY96937.1 tRNA (adenosine(37)-N6)-threonylcarbamoyltransferase complex ATPase subunit type 1 TsaE [Wenzhouxiangella limi]
MSETFILPTEQDMLDFGVPLAARLADGGVVYLSGDLGVGKTTLVRGLLRAMGHAGRVKSPSYGLVESYDLEGLTVHHLDLYRLGEAEEIEFLGIPDLLDEQSLLLVEWAEKGVGYLPPATLHIAIEDLPDQSRRLTIEKTVAT